MAKPTTYSDELADFIIDGLWQGKTIPQLEREDDRIRRRTISDWRKKHPEFDERYRDAMVGGAWAIVDETREIVDNLGEPADSRKLRAWQRFEEAKRKAPEVMSEKLALQHSGAVGHFEMTHEQWLASLK